jgi:MarR family transcriptional regulator, lower aerobic nicotinate degradation pathway regulator
VRGPDPRHVRLVMDSLRRIVRSFQISARAVESRLGISAAQLFVLHQLAEADAASIEELATRTLTHQSSVSVVVTRLAARDLVTRRTARDDARRSEIALTAAGRAMLRNAPEILQERLLRALARLRPRQLRALVEQLGMLVAALELDADVAGMFFEDESPGTVRRRPTRRPAR